MKKKIALFMSCMLLCAAIFTCDSMSVQSAAKPKITSKGRKAIKAYQEFLGQSTIQWSNLSYASEKFCFILIDLNKDGVPELFLKNMGSPSHYEGYQAVYSYNKNKIQKICYDDEITSFFPKSGIMETNYFGMGGRTSYVKILKNGKMKEIAYIKYSHPTVPQEKTTYYWCNGKKEIDVTKSKFNRLLKKTAGKKSVKLKESDWHNNTASNRKNMRKLLKK